jgi:hypothetical protein
MKEFLSTPDIPTMKTEHADARRVIREVALKQCDGSLRRVTSIEVNAPQEGEEMVLGNHTHVRTEDFVIHSGNPKVLTAPLENPSDVTEHSFPEGGFIAIDPDVVHTFIFKEPGVLRSTMTGTFEESGTKPHKLV